MIRARQFILGFILLLGMTSLAAANSSRLVADLSKSNIAITSGFHGTDLLLFGAVDGWCWQWKGRCSGGSLRSEMTG